MTEKTMKENVAEAVAEAQAAEAWPFLYSVTWMAPWWVVSVLMHALVIALAGLLSMSLKLPAPDDAVVMKMTELEPRPAIDLAVPKPAAEPKQALKSKKYDTPPTDPTSDEASDITVPPDIKAVLGDHWETNNPDLPNTHGARGDEKSHIFYLESGKAEPAGGGMGGVSLEDVIGIGGNPSWGGVNGPGIGVDNGPRSGSFGYRDKAGRTWMIKKYGGPPGNNEVNLALRWLAYHQEADGHWDAKKFNGLKVDTACTGFALLAFLGAGHTEKVGEYKDNVRRAIAWLKSKQDANGLIWDTTDEGGYMGTGYPGAIATLAISEAAGMANVADTRAAAQKAIDYCTEKHQQGEGSEKGGWRYAAKSPTADLSVSGWFIMALKSAKVAVLHVNAASFDGAIKFLDSVEKKNVWQGSYGPASAYSYTPTEPRTNRRLCAIGNLCRQFLGWKKEDLQSSVEYFVNQGMPEWGANGENVDLYYWYYGTLCVFQQGGDLWKKWNESMKKALVDYQCKQGDDTGSWEPKGDNSDKWGRVGQTALSCLCLEVYYRYMQLQPDN